MNLHCFGEIDVETDKALSKDLFFKFFRACEDTGFFAEQIETEWIRFTGPFNIPDWYCDVSFNILWTITRKQIKEAWFSWRDNPNGDLKKHYIYHFLTVDEEIKPKEDFAFA